MLLPMQITHVFYSNMDEDTVNKCYKKEVLKPKPFTEECKFWIKPSSTSFKLLKSTSIILRTISLKIFD